ncbi:MAG: stilbene synthase [Opitutus sp.]|nr:stilbene synthase [Opitutus sp.]
MFLHALATAVPPTQLTQTECWERIARWPGKSQLSRRALLTLQAVLTRDRSIATRHFAHANPEDVMSFNPDELNDYFRTAAPSLAVAALQPALERAGITARALDALLVCTCTGYLCPGVTSYVSEQLGLRRDAFLQDLVGLGCGAAIPTLRAASAILAENPRAIVATVAVEVCSAAFYLDDDPGVLISACLFADGAAAAIWRGTPGDPALRCRDFSTVCIPGERDKLRFEQRHGRLRNLLDPLVPQLAGNAVGELYAAELLRENSRPLREIVAHPGGREVLDALDAVLPDFSLTPSREVLRHYGNLSSPSVLFALDEALRGGAPDESGDWWLVSFGAGFSAHACRFGV